MTTRTLSQARDQASRSLRRSHDAAERRLPRRRTIRPDPSGGNRCSRLTACRQAPGDGQSPLGMSRETPPKSVERRPRSGAHSVTEGETPGRAPPTISAHAERDSHIQLGHLDPHARAHPRPEPDVRREHSGPRQQGARRDSARRPALWAAPRDPRRDGPRRAARGVPRPRPRRLGGGPACSQGALARSRRVRPQALRPAGPTRSDRRAPAARPGGSSAPSAVARREVALGDALESPLVRMVCLDDDAPGKALSVLWDLELGARILKPESHGLGRTDRLDPPGHFGAYLHALKWSAVSAADATRFQAPFLPASSSWRISSPR